MKVEFPVEEQAKYVYACDMPIGSLGIISGGDANYIGHIVLKAHNFAVDLQCPSLTWRDNGDDGGLKVQLLPAGTKVLLTSEC